TAALNSALPPTIYAAPDLHAPVLLPNEHQVEVRGSLDGNRAVAIRFSPGQAVAVGTAMIGCAAVTAGRTGQRLAARPQPVPPAPGPAGTRYLSPHNPRGGAAVIRRAGPAAVDAPRRPRTVAHTPAPRAVFSGIPVPGRH